MLKRHSGWTRAALLFVWLTLLGVPALGQSFYGSLISVVKDDQEKVIPGATIILVNTATSERREGVTADDGVYRFLNLVPGTYRLEVELAGFQRYVRDQIEVNVQSAPRIEVSLQARQPCRDSSGHRRGACAANRERVGRNGGGQPSVQELSLNGRNVLNLITLAPSVVPQGSSEGSLTGKNVFAAGNYQIGGGTANQSASYFDGVTVQDSAYGNIVVLTPSPESVEEFRVQTNNSSAEFGRFTGGVINIASRSGTNTYRGSLFEYHRNKALNSNTFFGERAGLDKPPFVQNNFGGVAGRPGAQGQAVLLRQLRRATATAKACCSAAPCRRRRCEAGISRIIAERGDRRRRAHLRSVDAVRHQQPWHGRYQRRLRRPGVPNRLQFPGNIIPANRISPIAQKLLAFPDLRRPHGGRPLGPPTISSGTPRPAATTIRYNVRADYNLSQNQRLIGRVHALGIDQPSGRHLRQRPDQRRSVLARALHYDAGDGWPTRSRFNSTTVLDVRFGVLHWDYDRTPGNLGTNLVSTFGLPDGAVRPDFGTQRDPGHGNPSKHRGRPEPGHRHRSHLRGRLYVFVHADAHQDFRRSHAEGGREHPERLKSTTFRTTTRGARSPSPTRRRRSMARIRASTGDPFASFHDRPADGRHVPVIEFHLRPLAVPGLLRRGFVAGQLTSDRDRRLAPGEVRARTTETGDSLATFNPDLRQPASGGADEPGNGKAVHRCVRAGGERRATGAQSEEESPAGCAACRRGVSHHGRPRSCAPAAGRSTCPRQRDFQMGRPTTP